MRSGSRPESSMGGTETGEEAAEADSEDMGLTKAVLQTTDW
jgi:hypothetical protein